ncbi:hypothetical protein BDN72DRAFT_764051 [Pluteus cervinus]|uniref:Uncharacterized protein n=1 Tax=Pluteus cervinus TaxID=181527 RepID=A0ACD3B2Z9_9AGAR|nr:hypothetical protein BDN72DRAFT_764051 [Pluteus cervinus]
MVSLRATSAEVCHSVYGAHGGSPDAIERFYEANASDYENPFLTATSRSLISDIYRLSRQMSAVDIPHPVAVLCTLFRLKHSWLLRKAEQPLFHALRVWSKMGDIAESESFDGHRKTIVEHTLNILLLPGIHRDGPINSYPQHSPDNRLTTNSLSSHVTYLQPPSPSLAIPGTSLSIPSPLHFQLHVVTSLSFNEQSRITHHRDFWDVKDVIGLVPGISLAQWIGTRLAARSLSMASRFWTRTEALETLPLPDEERPDTPHPESDLTPAAAYMVSTRNALGLHGL